ncbi:DUF4253 domain-containing protein [Longispora sp. NPDC051575]|uniref:DUF4253 domain-containing protein n=1 Tax=Longispora sp. NPDC051575 TaxID=3154943 RepID=UPI003434CB97
MRNDLEHIEAAFVGTPLAGLPIGHGPAGTILVAGIDPRRLHEAWRAADALVPVTGRLPLLVTDDFTGPLAMLPEPEPGPSESRLREFTEAAASSEPWLTFYDPEAEEAVDEDNVEHYAHGLAGVDLASLASDLALPSSSDAFERALYDRLLADPELHDQVLDSVRFQTRTDNWYTPESVLLMLLPTSDVRSSGYWVDFFGALGTDAELSLAEVLAQWHHRWDARLVAAWGTMLQFQVGRAPAPGDEAWSAACQLKGLGPNLDLSRWEVATALSAGDAWFVHNRP